MFRLLLDPKTLSYANRDVDLISRDAESRTDESSSHFGLERAVTFHGTIGRQDSDSLPSRDSDFRENSSVASTDKQDKKSRFPRPPKTAPTVVGGRNLRTDTAGGNDFMKDIMLRWVLLYRWNNSNNPINM